jgi:hypothetical protein
LKIITANSAGPSAEAEAADADAAGPSAEAEALAADADALTNHQFITQSSHPYHGVVGGAGWSFGALGIGVRLALPRASVSEAGEEAGRGRGRWRGGGVVSVARRGRGRWRGGGVLVGGVVGLR